MNSTDRNAIEKLEKLYKKQIDIIKSAGVAISEIIVYQRDLKLSHKTPYGEFLPDRVSNPNFDAKAASIESESAVIARMYKHIQQLAAIAEKYHVENNFINPHNYVAKKISSAGALIPAPISDSQLDVKKQNHITRLSLNEFSFYPHSDRGPLTHAGFKEIVDLVEKQAEILPENIHLLLSSFPVLTANKRVLNIAIYVQCGSSPIINVFAKAYPAVSDRQYPRTRNEIYHESVHDDSPRTKLSASVQNFIKIFAAPDKNSDLIILDLFKQLMASFYANKVLVPHKKLIDIFDFIEQRISAKFYTPNRLGILLAVDDINQLITEINKFFHDSDDLLLKNAGKVLNPLLTDDIKAFELNKGMNIHYGGIIHCKTLGGVSFNTVIELCLDHRQQVGKVLIGNDIKSSRSAGIAALSQHSSHVVSSNHVTLVEENFVTSLNTQADPMHSRGAASLRKGLVADTKLINKAEAIDTPFFGSYTVIQFYKPRNLDVYIEMFDSQIQAHNVFMIRLNALKQFRNQYPGKYSVVNEEIIKHIFFTLEAEVKNILKDKKITIEQRTLIELYAKKIAALSVNNINEVINSLNEYYLSAVELEKKDDTYKLQSAVLSAYDNLKSELRDYDFHKRYHELLDVKKEYTQKKNLRSSFFKIEPLPEIALINLLLIWRKNADCSSATGTINLLLNQLIEKYINTRLLMLLKNNVSMSQLGVKQIHKTISNINKYQDRELSFPQNVLASLNVTKGFLKSLNTKASILDELQQLIVLVRSTLKEADFSAKSALKVPSENYLHDLLNLTSSLNQLNIKKIQGINGVNSSATDELKKFNELEERYSLAAQRLLNFIEDEKTALAPVIPFRSSGK